ncbi:MAG: hypothetical protein AAF725_15670 [Acidobacteriota bacterium]
MKRTNFQFASASSRLAIPLFLFLLLALAQSAAACPTGVAGKADPGATVCAESSSGLLYCRQANADGDFFLSSGADAPSTGGCLPSSDTHSFYQTSCPNDGMTVNRSLSAEKYGGDWLDVSCKPFKPVHKPRICLLATDWESTFGFTTTLWSVNAGTGAVFDPRPTGLGHVIGLAVDPTNTWAYAVSSLGGSPMANSLYRINMTTGASTLVGPLGIGNLFEGDLAFGDDGTLYGVQDDLLYSINTGTGAATVIGDPAGSDYSFLSFNGSNTLYAIDNSNTAGSPTVYLDELDETNADVTASQPIDELGGYGGMDWNQIGGWLWVADGKTPGSTVAGHRKLFQLNPVSGALTEVGPLGLSHGVTGLASCKPCAVVNALDTGVSEPAGELSHAQVLKMAYRVRDELLDSTRVGRHYAERFYSHSLRMVYLMAQDRSLRQDTADFLHLMAPGFLDLLDGNGQHRVRRQMVEKARGLAERFSQADRASGRGALAAALGEELQRLDLDRLRGLSFQQAWAHLNTLETEPQASGR